MKRKHASILFLGFNRPDATAKVFKTIKEAKPKRLYVAVDGPRFWKNGEFEQVAKVKKIATSVDWPCKVTTLFRKENLGVKYAISDAITWFFKYEREGIILEDDCVPVSNFFPFCEKLLDYYRNEKKVFAISGCNIKNNLKCDNESYHFSKYFHPWGWATWRRAWNHYDNEISFWPKWKKSRDWTLKMPIKAEQIIFKKIFDKEYFNQRENYDYRFMASILKNGGLIARHNLNLVNNIGWRLGTHNINEKDKHKYELVKKFKIELKHPKKVIQNKFKDSHLFFNLWDDKNLRMPRLLINLPIRLINYLLRKIS